MILFTLLRFYCKARSFIEFFDPSHDYIGPRHDRNENVGKGSLTTNKTHSTKSIYYHDSQFLPLSTTIKFVFNFFFGRVFRSSFFGSSAHIESAVEEKEGMGSSHNLQVEVPDMRRTVSDKL